MIAKHFFAQVLECIPLINDICGHCHQNYKTRYLVVSHFFLKNLIKNLLGRPFKDFGRVITPKIHNPNH